MTNFHLPRSTLFSAGQRADGTRKMQSAYGHAIKEGYRFYSYGDPSLLLPGIRRPEVAETTIPKMFHIDRQTQPTNAIAPATTICRKEEVQK